MFKITEATIPGYSLPVTYAQRNAFVDCYYVDIPKDVSLQRYINAFYTSSLFKVERTLLSIATFRFALDSEALELSLGKSQHYSIWTVESRLSDEILLCDFTNKTRSWLMVKKKINNGGKVTRLYFGSVVVPKTVLENGQVKFSFLFHALSQFHHLYSRALLSAAYKKLLKEGIEQNQVKS